MKIIKKCLVAFLCAVLVFPAVQALNITSRVHEKLEIMIIPHPGPLTFTMNPGDDQQHCYLGGTSRYIVIVKKRDGTVVAADSDAFLNEYSTIFIEQRDPYGPVVMTISEHQIG